MKKLSLSVLSLVAMMSLMISCQNTQSGDYEVNSNGLKYRFYEKNDGATPQIEDLIEVNMACFVNDTTTIIPAGHNVLQLKEPLFAGDIFEGFAMMHIGDSASFIVRIDSTFITLFGSGQLPPEFTVNDVMRFEVKVTDFYPESEFKTKMIEGMKKQFPEETAKAESELKAYLEQNGITVEPTATGLYYVKTQDGDGINPKAGDKVKVHYVGKLLDGTQFDSSIDRGEPIEFPLGNGYVIPGWDEGIMLMSKGEKGVLYIPYYLGYGNRESGPIPAFATLIFDVELVDFEGNE